jgi:hypothetical protein
MAPGAQQMAQTRVRVQRVCRQARTAGFSKMNFSEPEPLHGTSESLHDSRSPMSSVAGVCATRYWSWYMLMRRISYWKCDLGAGPGRG